MIIPAKMPSFIKTFFPNYVWDFFGDSKKTSDNVLYLTFDDGPQEEITEFVLDELDKYNAKATFFCIGANVEKRPDIFKKLISNGHAIGNHTQHHLEGWKTDTKDYISNTLKAHEILKTQISNSKFQSSEIKNRKSTPDSHRDVNLFRPPYGRITKAQGRQLLKLGYKVIMWDVVAKDWYQDISEEKCLANILDNAKNGSIVVLHDSAKASKNVRYVLPKVLEHFSNKKFQFKAIEL